MDALIVLNKIIKFLRRLGLVLSLIDFLICVYGAILSDLKVVPFFYLFAVITYLLHVTFILQIWEEKYNLECL